MLLILLINLNKKSFLLTKAKVKWKVLLFSLYQIFPARAPVMNSTEVHNIQDISSEVLEGSGKTALAQGGYQILALAVTLCLATVGGLITGV